MKKILLSIAVIGFVGVIAAGATSAYFSDTETSTGNTFTAGTLNLQVNDADNWSASTPVTLSAMKPGDTTDTTLKLSNTGSINGTGVSLAVAVVSNFENSVADPESDVDTTAGVNEGELCSSANITVKDGTTVIKTGTLSAFGAATLAALNAGASKTYTLTYDIPGTVGNVIQSDSCVFTLTATLNQ